MTSATAKPVKVFDGRLLNPLKCLTGFWCDRAASWVEKFMDDRKDSMSISSSRMRGCNFSSGSGRIKINNAQCFICDVKHLPQFIDDRSK